MKKGFSPKKFETVVSVYMKQVHRSKGKGRGKGIKLIPTYVSRKVRVVPDAA